jgi:copper oxidase (laccase) domain-containing protein
MSIKIRVNTWGGDPVKLESSGDFIYTRNPDTVLAVRPADCPIAVISAETPKGETQIMVHFAWRGSAFGQFADMKNELDALGVDYETMRVYITPGGHAETYQFSNYRPDDKNNPMPIEGNLFVGVEKHTGGDGVETYSFGMDTPNDIYESFIDLGLDKKQVFIDTSDTTALDSGYASHSRAMNLKDDNVRDLVTVQRHG